MGEIIKFKYMKNVYIIALLLFTFTISCVNDKNVEINVASYNLRMDTERDSLNSWNYRKDNVNSLITYHDFDIFGTQEGFYHQLQDILRLGNYQYIGVGRDDGDKAGEHSAIFYKPDKFDLLENGDFWLSETPSIPGKGWDATCCNRICSWGKFREIISNKVFYFFNVHFDHQGVIAREESGKLMVEKIKEIAGDNPIIATGDFNSDPETIQIKTLSNYLNDSYFVTQNAPYGPSGTFNSRFKNPIGAKRIDYIFTSSYFDVLKYAHLTDNNGLYYPSDHIPVLVVLKFK